MLLDLSHRTASEIELRSEAGGLATKGMDEHEFLGRKGWWQDNGQVELELSLQENKAAFHSVAGIIVSESSTSACVCLLKVALLGLGLQWGFTISRSQSSQFLFVDGCQNFVSVEGGDKD